MVQIDLFDCPSDKENNVSKGKIKCPSDKGSAVIEGVKSDPVDSFDSSRGSHNR